MKTPFLTAALALACAFSASAQDHPDHRRGMMKSPEERAKHHAEMLDKKLNLSDEQRAKIETIDLQMARDMQRNAEAMKPQRDEMREKMKAMQANRDAEYKRVLTPEQFDNFQKFRAERMEKHRRMADQGLKARPDADKHLPHQDR